MKKSKFLISYFNKVEIALWAISVLSILISFLIFDRNNYLNLIGSIIGVTSLIFYAKANPLAQVFMLIFSIIYAYISYTFRYWGEISIFLFMTIPSLIVSFIAWIKNPFNGKRSEVKVGDINKKDVIVMIILTIVVTVVFYFILKFLNTNNLAFSTFSIATSFMASYLTLKRSDYFALAFIFNDVILIILWGLASFKSTAYICTEITFISFLFNDLYGFINWAKIKKYQKLKTDKNN